MITILCGRDGRPSMKKVYAQMQSDSQLVVRRRLEKKGKQWLRVYTGNEIEKFKKRPINELTLASKKVIRWGNRIEAETSKDTIVYNRSEAVARGSNKRESRLIFAKEKVRSPKLVKPGETKDSDFPIIARPSRHAKGKNFIVLKTKGEFENHYSEHEKDGWYYSAFVDKEREFRVHCAHGKVLAVMEKAQGGDKIAWNRAQTGEAFTRVPQNEYKYSICFQALKAVQALGLDFAGVDVMLKTVRDKEGKTKENGYVLEVNTSPTLNSSDFVSEQYAKYFDWLNRLETRRPHWDFSKFENPQSFAWKQFQLMDTEPTLRDSKPTE